jgi:septal ring factor EnvC (AmiA/AmiB activator)
MHAGAVEAELREAQQRAAALEDARAQLQQSRDALEQRLANASDSLQASTGELAAITAAHKELDGIATEMAAAKTLLEQQLQAAVEQGNRCAGPRPLSDVR